MLSPRVAAHHRASMQLTGCWQAVPCSCPSHYPQAPKLSRSHQPVRQQQRCSRRQQQGCRPAPACWEAFELADAIPILPEKTVLPGQAPQGVTTTEGLLVAAPIVLYRCCSDFSLCRSTQQALTHMYVSAAFSQSTGTHMAMLCMELSIAVCTCSGCSCSAKPARNVSGGAALCMPQAPALLPLTSKPAAGDAGHGSTPRPSSKTLPWSSLVLWCWPTWAQSSYSRHGSTEAHNA